MSTILPAPEIFADHNPIVWVLFLGSSGSLVFHTVFRVSKATLLNIVTVAKAFHSIPETREDAEKLGLIDPVSFCRYMSKQQTVLMRRPFSDNYLFAITEDAFRATNNPLFRQMFGRDPICGFTINDKTTITAGDGRNVYCDSMIDCWLFYVVGEMKEAGITTKTVEGV